MLVFSRFLCLRGNLGNVEEKLTRKTFFRENKRLVPRILPCKILLGGISLMSTKFLLYFHDIFKILKRGRVFEKI